MIFFLQVFFNTYEILFIMLQHILTTKSSSVLHNLTGLSNIEFKLLAESFEKPGNQHKRNEGERENANEKKVVVEKVFFKLKRFGG
jgi:hypothetical protein